MNDIQYQIECANEMIEQLVGMYDKKMQEAKEISSLIEQATATKIDLMNLLVEVSHD